MSKLSKASASSGSFIQGENSKLRDQMSNYTKTIDANGWIDRVFINNISKSDYNNEEVRNS